MTDATGGHVPDYDFLGRKSGIRTAFCVVDPYVKTTREPSTDHLNSPIVPDSKSVMATGLLERLVLVGLGGMIGTLLRYGTGGLVARLKAGATFPFETLVVNVAGCLLIGFLAGISEVRGVFSPPTRSFLFVGLLGGFTTFSTFGYETLQLLRDGQIGAGLGSVALQVVLGLGAVWAGDLLARLAGA
jgi:fluoride exporter